MADPTLEWRVEEACLNAWPALREVLLEGWLLRFSDGLTRRANSANPLRPVRRMDLRACEALYRRLGLPTIFRVLSLNDPSVDERLAKAGYTAEGESCVLYGAIEDIEAASDADVRLRYQPAPEWFGAMAALQNHSSQQAATYRRIVGQLAIPAAFAALSVEGDTIALAYGAVHNGLLCYESVITDSRRRRQGHGRRVITTLAAWAKEQGACGACLEVEAINAPARALYDALGLKTELYRYHYRREPDSARL
ncbi:MAG TPA: GNAT family N-acetyltransferase [Stellaceae bacterium]|nr:GNAT family N-acetyltransferase [Stellaceae bacterium]